MKPTRTRRAGFSLLELAIAMAMMATLAAASMVLLRTSQSAWNRHQSDLGRRKNATAVLRHIVRGIRQSAAVTNISDASDVSGTLSVIRADGVTLVWDHDDANDEVEYGETVASSLLAENITGMTMIGLKADGSTATTDTDLIHNVRCTLTFIVERPTGPSAEQVSSQAWLRSW